MKRYLYILCAILMGVFASCSKSEIGDETPQSNQVTLKVTTDEGLQTRGIDQTVDRYAIEVYTDATYTTAATEVFGTTNKADNATGEFTMAIDRTKEYYCLIWADKAGAGVYDITSLKAVTLTGNAVEAWHGTKKIEAGAAAPLEAMLTRAVSKITLMETGTLKAGSTLKLNFDQPTMFNVADGTTATAVARAEETISIEADVDGTTTPVKLNTADIFVLSSVATADLTDLTFAYNTENPFIVSKAPLKANFNTNVKGHYTSAQSTTFTVTADDEWETPDNNVDSDKKAVQVGDFFYKDKTISSTYTADAANPCIGIVFWIDPADSKKGKIVGLTEETGKYWSAATGTTDANSADDGAGNTTKILAMGDFSAAAYPAFELVKSQNDANTVAGIKWYLPAKEELQALYGNYNDNSPVDSSVKDAVNTSLRSVSGAAQLSTDYYWSSTEAYASSAFYVIFNDGDTRNGPKVNTSVVRVVSAF